MTKIEDCINDNISVHKNNIFQRYNVGGMKEVGTSKENGVDLSCSWFDGKYLFLQKPQPFVFCGICSMVLTEPVVLPTCGHTFCTSCIIDKLDCPIDKVERGSNKVLVPNLVISDLVGKLMIFCPFESEYNLKNQLENVSVCKNVIAFSEESSHANTCLAAFIDCPNEGCDKKVRRRDIHEHLFECSFSKTSKRCLWTFDKERGSFLDIKDHMSICVYLKEEEDIDDQMMSKPILLIQQAMTNMEDKILQNEKENQTFKKEIVESNYTVSQSHSKLEVEINSLKQEMHLIKLTLGEIQAQLSKGKKPSLNTTLFKCVGTYKGHESSLWSLAFKDNILFSGDNDSQLKSWDIRSNMCQKSIDCGLGGSIHCLLAHKDYLYIGSVHGKLQVRNIDDLKLVKDIVIESPTTNPALTQGNVICCLKFHKNRIFVGTFAAILVYDAFSLELKYVINDLEYWVRSMAVDLSKNCLFAGTHNAIHVLNLDSLEKETVLRFDFGSIFSMLTTSQYLIVGTYNQNIHLYNLTTLEYFAPLIGHLGTVYGLAGLYKGQFVISASFDGTVKIWNLNAMLCVQTLRRHDDGITDVVLINESIFSASADGNIKLFLEMNELAL